MIMFKVIERLSLLCQTEGNKMFIPTDVGDRKQHKEREALGGKRGGGRRETGNIRTWIKRREDQ